MGGGGRGGGGGGGGASERSAAHCSASQRSAARRSSRTWFFIFLFSRRFICRFILRDSCCVRGPITQRDDVVCLFRHIISLGVGQKKGNYVSFFFKSLNLSFLTLLIR